MSSDLYQGLLLCLKKERPIFSQHIGVSQEHGAWCDHTSQPQSTNLGRAVKLGGKWVLPSRTATPAQEPCLRSPPAASCWALGSPGALRPLTTRTLSPSVSQTPSIHRIHTGFAATLEYSANRITATPLIQIQVLASFWDGFRSRRQMFRNKFLTWLWSGKIKTEKIQDMDFSFSTNWETADIIL